MKRTRKAVLNWFKVTSQNKLRAVSDVHFGRTCAIAAIFMLYYLPSPICEI